MSSDDCTASCGRSFAFLYRLLCSDFAWPLNVNNLLYSSCSNPQCLTTLSCHLLGDCVSGQRGCADFPIHAQALAAEKNIEIQNRKRASGTRQLHLASRIRNSSSRRAYRCSFQHCSVPSPGWRLPSLHPEDATCSKLSEPKKSCLQSRSKLRGVEGEPVSCCVLSMCEIPVGCSLRGHRFCMR